MRICDVMIGCCLLFLCVCDVLIMSLLCVVCFVPLYA